ncbi:MAG: helix-turn-helix domain-containing protein [Chloroflexota bacterium]|nr:helix-turn-helix domain-containing protein [Chloroflexota bacterium]
MPRPYQWTLDAAQVADLVDLRDHAQRPYLRERAAVLLAVAGGQSLRQAARWAGLTPHKVDSVCCWVQRYRAEGRSGLCVRKGRGRKPAHFPAHPRRRAGGAAARHRPTT